MDCVRPHSSPNTHFDIHACWNVRLDFTNLRIRTKAFILKGKAHTRNPDGRSLIFLTRPLGLARSIVHITPNLGDVYWLF